MFYQERDLIDQPDTLDEENKNPNRSVSIVDLETFSYLCEFIFIGSYITYINFHRRSLSNLSRSEAYFLLHVEIFEFA